jgi:hypothetical protein
VRRSAGTLAAVTLAITLAACGGGATTTSQEPALPRSVADGLASKSDEIAEALENGDQCGAAHYADELKDRVDAAIADGRIPQAFEDELVGAATDLQNEVNCVESKPAHKDQDKGKKKNHEGATTTLGTTISTTTQGSG